ncbi:MAG: glycosyltransferase family 9 protein, partial [Acidobacteriota bacterium]
REPASRIFLNHTVEIPPQTHVIRKNLILAGSAFNIPLMNGDIEFPIFTEERHRMESEQIVAQTNGNFAILNPAGGWVTKLWPAERFGQLADVLWEDHGLHSVVAIGPDDTQLGEQALAASRSGRTTLAKPSLKGFFELARRARVYVGGDTGPTHLAIAAGSPVVGIFGPTEWWRNGSLSSSDICVERTDIDCRVDCHRRTCSNWICMDISVERVRTAVAERLGQKNPAHQASKLPVMTS